MTSFGMWGIIPPLLTIVLAFVTKDVIVSLFLGILSGTLIIAGGNPLLALVNLTDALAASLVDEWNIRIFLFCALLGGLVGMLSKTGAAGAFGQWASAKLKTSKGASLMTFIFGLIIFIDDYFNSLTVGTIMRPISDKTKISRAKLSYILDSTAAPVCIIAPISSWVVTVMSIVKGSEGFDALHMTPFEFFIRSIPYNLYALGALAFVLIIILTKRDFGPMKESEALAVSGKLFNEEKYGAVVGEVDSAVNSTAKPIDMLFPIIVLILTALIFFPVTTWMSAVDGETYMSFSQAAASISVSDAFKDTDASVALFYSIIFTIFATYIYYIARKLLNLSGAGEALRDGIKSMIPALIILVMAWTIGTIIKSSPEDGGLGLGTYLSALVVKGNFPLALIPMIVFALSALISFATGTSWGTFGIMIPLVMPIATGLAQAKGLDQHALVNACMICIAAVVGGAVFGDHASPISDTTILSSTGAGCPHLEHVATQMPYAIFIALCSAVGFIAGGFVMNIFVAWIVFAAVLAAGIVFLPKMFESK
ncbi:MAG: Na+/H+ antiporter NhaC family protein [Treponema sp.]|nr:Na+/H+ antiporter NhaC family protein [Treponema sp.]